MFLEAQGYPLKNNILYQDNQSAIKMEKMVEIPVQATHDTSISGIFGSEIE